MNARKEHDVEDASDRAAKRRKSQLMRVPLRKITFWNSNRGGMAISGHHVHQIAHGIMTTKTKLMRYGHVDIVEIPANLLEKIRKENRERCSQEPLLPLFHEDIAYVCITKTHFTHAQKLAQDGNRFLYNGTDMPIKWQADDTEGAEIQESGPLCQIFDSVLFDDPNAMDALGTEDNLNADIAMGEDEMQAFGRISGIMARMSACQDKDVLPNAMTQCRCLALADTLMTIGGDSSCFAARSERGPWRKFCRAFHSRHALVLSECDLMTSRLLLLLTHGHPGPR